MTNITLTFIIMLFVVIHVASDWYNLHQNGGGETYTTLTLIAMLLVAMDSTSSYRQKKKQTH